MMSHVLEDYVPEDKVVVIVANTVPLEEALPVPP
jgi:hypothetical protein